eukprot:1159675-Pelagomonas_calceolata.AAC.3
MARGTSLGSSPVRACTRVCACVLGDGWGGRGNMIDETLKFLYKSRTPRAQCSSRLSRCNLFQAASTLLLDCFGYRHLALDELSAPVGRHSNDIFFILSFPSGLWSP